MQNDNFDATVKKFLRYYWGDLVEYALDLAQLDDNERQAVELCGRRRLTIEQAAEEAEVSVNTMQARWSKARKRLARCWAGLEWVHTLADTVDD